MFLEFGEISMPRAAARFVLHWPPMTRLLHYFLGFALVFPAIILHEIAHGYAAWLCGDPTAKWRGRLSLNPLRHIDPVGTIVLPAVLILTGISPIGWAKPVPIDLSRTRRPRQAIWIVGIAGPAMNLVLALLAGLGLRAMFLTGWVTTPAPGYVLFPGEVARLTFTVLQVFCFSNLMLMLFNLVPIPPLDGSRVVTALLPPRLAWEYLRLERYGFLIVLLLLNLVPAFGNALEVLARGAFRLLSGIS